MRSSFSVLLFLGLLFWMASAVAQTPGALGFRNVGPTTGTIVEVFVKK